MGKLPPNSLHTIFFLTVHHSSGAPRHLYALVLASSALHFSKATPSIIQHNYVHNSFSCSLLMLLLSSVSTISGLLATSSSIFWTNLLPSQRFAFFPFICACATSSSGALWHPFHFKFLAFIPLHRDLLFLLANLFPLSHHLIIHEPVHRISLL